MEILISVAAKAAEYIVAPIKRGATFILCPGSIYRETQKKYEQLQNKHTEVTNRYQQAKNDGEEVTQEVDQWLSCVQATSLQAQRFLESFESKTNMSNWVRAHRHRKDAIRHKRKLLDLLGQGEKLSHISRIAPAKGIQLLTGDGFIVFNSVKFAFDNIMEALRREDQSMIGVHGMGGIGKTSLVRKTIIAAEETQLFKRVVVSVVSQSPNIHKIQAELGEQLCLRYSRETEIGRATQLMTRLKHEDKILVILDDVWDKIDLDKIGIPFGDDHKGCKVLLTTRRKRVCTSMGCEPTIMLSFLSDTESWELFKRHAGAMLSTPNELEEVAQEVTRECNGLPLALVVVASALRDKSLEEWKFALKKLQSSRLTDLEDIEQNVYERIKLSYDFLRAELTKRCFLMCSLFPEDYEISAEVLTRYAMGYGLFDQDSTIDTYMDAKEQVKIMIGHLLSGSLLLLIKRDGMSEHVKMHDMVRDAALWITSKGEDIFLVPIPSQPNWNKDPKLVNATAISLLSCPNKRRLPSAMEQCSKLKMFLLAQRVPLHIENTCFEKMLRLQVLDMTAIAARQLDLTLPHSLEHLINLRTLYLRRWKLNGDLSVIRKFQRLEILSFAGSLIDELPKELKELSELKILDLSACRARKGFDSVVISELVLRVEEFCPPNKPIVDFSYDEE